MGRAFPEVQMTTFFIYGQDPSPAAIADDKGNVVVFNKVVDMFWLERFARHIAGRSPPKSCATASSSR